MENFDLYFIGNIIFIFILFLEIVNNKNIGAKTRKYGIIISILIFLNISLDVIVALFQIDSEIILRLFPNILTSIILALFVYYFLSILNPSKKIFKIMDIVTSVCFWSIIVMLLYASIFNKTYYPIVDNNVVYLSPVLFLLLIPCLVSIITMIVSKISNSFYFQLIFLIPFIALTCDVFSDYSSQINLALTIMLMTSRFELVESLLYIDKLTQLKNRTALYKFSESAVPNGQYLYVLFIDVDNFKSYNDRFGHKYGDKVLYDLSQIFTKTFSRTKNIFRISGDEFLIAFFDAKDNCLENLKQSLDNNIAVYNKINNIDLSVTIGEVIVKEFDNFSIVMEQADANMYNDKRVKKN